MQVVVCLLLCLAALASADQSWDFRGVNSKQEAKQRALASLASADLNDENQPVGCRCHVFRLPCYAVSSCASNPSFPICSATENKQLSCH